MLGLGVRFITKQLVGSLVLGLLMTAVCEAGSVSRPTKSFGGTSFINGVIPQASDFNGDVDTIYTDYNGNISNTNISASAAIAASKLDGDGFTTNVRTVNTAPCNILDESDQSADAKRWYACLVSGEFRLTTNSDVGVVQNTWLTINRANGGFAIGGTGGTNTINGATTFNQNVTFNGSTSFAPSGTVQLYMGTSAPTGWLLMDGSSVSCTGTSSANANLCAQLVSLFGSANYKGSALGTFTVDTSSDEIIHASHGKSTGDRVHFSSTTTLPAGLSATTVYCIISTTSGRYKVSTTCGGTSVDITDPGSGTHSDYVNFLVPDMRGRVAVGTGTGSGLSARTIGATGGVEDAVVVSHNHTLTDPGHTHQIAITGGGSSGIPNLALNGTGSTNISTNTTGISLASTGVSGTGMNMDPFLVMTYIIKL